MWQTNWTSRCLTAHTLALSLAVVTYLNMTADGGEPLSGDADFEGGPNNCCSASAALHCMSSCESKCAVGLEMISTGLLHSLQHAPLSLAAEHPSLRPSLTPDRHLQPCQLLFQLQLDYRRTDG